MVPAQIFGNIWKLQSRSLTTYTIYQQITRRRPDGYLDVEISRDFIHQSPDYGSDGAPGNRSNGQTPGRLKCLQGISHYR